MEKDKTYLKTLIGRFAGKKVAVWGDFILDEYLTGTTRRVSREAPVLIISYRNREFTLGGAGNSLLNLKALGAYPIPVGVVGGDEAGERIMDILRSRRIPTKFLISLPSFETAVKTRILAGEENTRKQQILRIDKEFRVPETAALKAGLLRRLKEAISLSSALLVSDYNYLTVRQDVFADIISICHKIRMPVTLDSRFRLLSFPYVTIATPNEPEVESALGTETGGRTDVIRNAGKVLLRKLRSPGLLITRGSQGMALFERGKRPLFIPVHGSTDIVDVTGAGDTVISVITLALACGASFREAAYLANYAGGIVVMKKGTATVSPDELRKALES